MRAHISRTGLPFNNPIRIYGYDLPEAMHRMQFLPFVDDFRDDYVFNNLMFAIAAWVIENLDGIKTYLQSRDNILNMPRIDVSLALGRTWEDFAKQELLDKLGMSASTFAGDESRWSEFATGHYVDDVKGELRAVSLEVTRAYFEAWSAAGSVVSNAVDMLEWIKFQLNDGTTSDGTELLSRTEFEFTHQPSMQKRAPPRWQRPVDPVTYKFGTHSVAWSEHTYRDVQTSQHIGGETGFQSLITVSRAAQFGIFTGINKDPHQVLELSAASQKFT